MKFSTGCHEILKVTKTGRIIIYSDRGFEEALTFARSLGYQYWVWNGLTKSGTYWLQVAK